MLSHSSVGLDLSCREASDSRARGAVGEEDRVGGQDSRGQGRKGLEPLQPRLCTTLGRLSCLREESS
jgi:hypothetical protein